MRILVLGGTSFVGRAVVERALSGGHDITLFSRGPPMCSHKTAALIISSRI